MKFSGSDVVFRAKLATKSYPVSGTLLADTVTMTSIDARTIQEVWRENGRVVITIRRTISPDGKRMTAVSSGTMPEGDFFERIYAYDKQWHRLIPYSRSNCRSRDAPGSVNAVLLRRAVRAEYCRLYAPTLRFQRSRKMLSGAINPRTNRDASGNTERRRARSRMNRRIELLGTNHFATLRPARCLSSILGFTRL